MLGIEDVLGIDGIDGIDGMLGIGLIVGIGAVEPIHGIFFISSFMVFICASIGAQQFFAGCQLEGANSMNRPAATMKIPTVIPVTASVGYSQRVRAGRVVVALVVPASVTAWSGVGWSGSDMVSPSELRRLMYCCSS